MLIYYGYPALINGSQSLSEAASHFEHYSMVILGDGLQDRRHPNHLSASEIIANLPAVDFFGYIDLGVQSPHHRVQNLPIEEIAERATSWKQMGARGILLDDYGYDFATDRQRQIDAVRATHHRDLRVIANSWDPRHALDSEPGPANPKGLASPLSADDFYLYESYLIREGDWVSFKQWRAKANTLNKLKKSSPVQLISCTTSISADTLAKERDFVHCCAWLEGHVAFAWGEPNFSATDNRASWQPPPVLPKGRRGPATPAGSSGMRCPCQSGLAVVDYATKSFEVQPRKPWWKGWIS